VSEHQDPRPRYDADAVKDLARDLAEVASQISTFKGEANAYLGYPTYNALRLRLEIAHAAVVAAAVEARRQTEGRLRAGLGRGFFEVGALAGGPGLTRGKPNRGVVLRRVTDPVAMPAGFRSSWCARTIRRMVFGRSKHRQRPMADPLRTTPPSGPAV
jgi:hypothetical protein